MLSENINHQSSLLHRYQNASIQGSTWYMVQIEALGSPECQKGVPSQGEEHRVVNHVQVEHYHTSFRAYPCRLRVWLPSPPIDLE